MTIPYLRSNIFPPPPRYVSFHKFRPWQAAVVNIIYVQSLPKADVVEWLATEAVLIIERYT